MTTGIYAIKHIGSGRMYIGCSVNIEQRWRQHLHKLRSERHPTQKLQNAWTKHGETMFEFIVLESCHEYEMIAVEQRQIDDSECFGSGYNISAVAGRERAGMKHTQEAIDRMSSAHLGKVISSKHKAKLSEAFKGRVFSKETRAKISAAKTGKKRSPFSDEARANMSSENGDLFLPV